jgi:DNA repair protein RadD
MHPKSAYCADCGYVFPEEPAHAATASAKPIMRDEAASQAYDDLHVSYAEHHKPGSPTSLRVSYHAGMRVVAREWVCLEHQGLARSKARLWWRQRAGSQVEPPGTIDEAMLRTDELRTPSTILVDETQPYPTIIGVKFDERHTV